MDKIKAFLKKSSKNLIFISVLMITAAFTVYTITKALENEFVICYNTSDIA